MRYSFAAAALLSSAAVVSAQGYNHPLYSRDHEVYARNPMAAGIDPMNYMSTELYGRMAEPDHDAVAAAVVRAREASDLRARKAAVLRRSIPQRQNKRRDIPQRQNKRRGIPKRRVQRRNKASSGGYRNKEPMSEKGHKSGSTPDLTQDGAEGIKRRFPHVTPMQRPSGEQQPKTNVQADAEQLKFEVAPTGNTAPKGDGTASSNSHAAADHNAGANANANANAKAAPASPPAQKYRRNALAIGTRSAGPGPAPAPATTSNEPGFFAKIARSLGF